VTDDPRTYLDYGGKRLTSDRNTIAVPLAGNSFRVMFHENASRLYFCGVLTHGDYDNLIGNGIGGRRLRVMEPVYPPTIGDLIKQTGSMADLTNLARVVEREMEKPVHVQEELPMNDPVPVKKKRIARKVRTGNLKTLVTRRLEALPVGERFSAHQLAEATGGSETGVMLILKPRINAGEIEYAGIETRRQHFRKVAPKGSTVQSREQLAERLLELAAAVGDLPKPQAAPVVTIKSFTDAELIAEINARMTARAAA
jgi:hypothetical protein